MGIAELEDVFYEDLFVELLAATKLFTFEYDHTLGHYKETEYIRHRVIGVNSFHGSYAFKAGYRKLAKIGLDRLFVSIKDFSYEEKLSFLENIGDEVRELRSLVKNKWKVDEENEYGPREEHPFVGFVKVAFEGSEGSDPYHKIAIEFVGEVYPKAFIEVVEEVEQKIKFMTNQLELHPPDPVIPKPFISIFYSFQSDIPAERNFIWKGLNEIVKTKTYNGKKVKIESDMRETSGSQNIPRVLFEKIDKCDIFIADVNLAFKSLTREGVFAPNPNVMIELGYAAGKIGWDNIIMLFNTESNKIEDLPFDIRQRSILWYEGENLQQLVAKLNGFILAITNKMG